MNSLDVDNPITTDFDATLRDFNLAFSDVPRVRTTIYGSNFVTGERLATFMVKGRLVELSTGVMPVFGERPPRSMRLFGCTVRPDPYRQSTLLDPDELHSMADVRRAFDALADELRSL